MIDIHEDEEEAALSFGSHVTPMQLKQYGWPREARRRFKHVWRDMAPSIGADFESGAYLLRKRG